MGWFLWVGVYRILAFLFFLLCDGGSHGCFLGFCLFLSRGFDFGFTLCGMSGLMVFGFLVS